jgi:hypothetical protein
MRQRSNRGGESTTQTRRQGGNAKAPQRAEFHEDSQINFVPVAKRNGPAHPRVGRGVRATGSYLRGAENHQFIVRRLKAVMATAITVPPAVVQSNN